MKTSTVFVSVQDKLNNELDALEEVLMDVGGANRRTTRKDFKVACYRGPTLYAPSDTHVSLPMDYVQQRSVSLRACFNHYYPLDDNSLLHIGDIATALYTLWRTSEPVAVDGYDLARELEREHGWCCIDAAMVGRLDAISEEVYLQCTNTARIEQN